MEEKIGASLPRVFLEFFSIEQIMKGQATITINKAWKVNTQHNALMHAQAYT